MVLAREDRPGQKRLVAYVVGGGSAALDPAELKRGLQRQLAEALVPSAFVLLPHLPTLPNGKIDRHALPAPELPVSQAQRLAPRTPVEQTAWDIWRDVLHVPQFGVDDNFFELGGHSLLAMQVISRLREALQIELPLRALFDAPTVAQLAAWIGAQTAQPDHAAIPKATPEGAAPLTAAQQGLWFMEQLRAQAASSNITQATRLRGPLDLAVLQQALQMLCARHDSLRSRVVQHDGVPAQVTEPHAPWLLQRLELPAVDAAQRESALRDLLTEFAHRPFDLAQAPQTRACVVRLGEQEHVIALAMHHIVCDGWSLDILLRELAALYSALRSAAPPSLTALPLQWRDIAFWERARLQSGELDPSLTYWRQQLEGLEPLRLPAEALPCGGADETGPLETLALPHDLVLGIETLARHHNATVFMVLLAAFKLLLMRRFGQQNVAVGTPVAGRDRPELEPVVGLLLNTLVLRTDLGGDPSFAELLRRVRGTTLDAWAHQDVPFDRLVAGLSPTRDAEHSPFFDVLVNAFGRWNGTLQIDGLAAEGIPLAPPPTKFALTLYIQAEPGDIGLGVVYRTDRLAAPAVRCLLDQLAGLLQQVVAQPTLALSDASLLTPSADALLSDPSAPLVPPPFVSVVERARAQAQRHPERPAVRAAQRELSHAELQRAATVLAQRLHDVGVQKGDVVAISGPRSVAVVASMLASLMCGAVFVMLDPALPVLRRQIMLRESRARWLCLVGRDAALDAAHANAGTLATLVLHPDLEDLLLDADGVARALTPVFTPVAVQPDDPAYIFFTSGSTGTPKAVLGRHSGLSHFVDWQRDEFGVRPDDRVSQLIGLSFDPLLRDVFLPLTSGATLCIPQDRDLLDPIGWLAREAISIVHTTPTVMQSWLQSSRTDSGLPALRWLFVAGEPLTDALVGAWRHRFGMQARIVNLYGPTETTMARCFHVLGDALAQGIQPVGHPLPHSQALVLDTRGRRCGIGEIGEVALRTPLRSLGYVGLPEETARRFRPNPWSGDATDLLYFTGDLGRLRFDGALEIVGRIDDQVKIRGVRVEPAEVMAALARHPAVRHCVVVPLPDEDGQPMLVAYVAAQGEPPQASDLRAHLAGQLPEAFVPAAFVFMDSLPTQANGKVDRKRLPPPTEPGEGHDTHAERLVMPRSPVEQALWEIWRNVLRTETFGVFESFFELGGHSLLATQVVARVRDVLGVELPLRALFETPSIAGLANAVEQRLHAAPDAALPAWPAITRVARGGLLPTSYSQRRMWLVQQFNPATTAYNMPFAVRLRGLLDPDVLLESLQRLVERHEAFRTTLVAVAGEPMQRIAPVERLAVEILDLSQWPEGEREAEGARALNLRSTQPYELAHGPLHRPTLLRFSEQDHVLFWSIHHAIGDGWSAGILMREIAHIYPALAQGREPSLPPMVIDFADYADWQRRVMDGAALANQLGFWERALAGLEPLPLPFDRPRRGETNGRGASVSAAFQLHTLSALKALAVQHGVTPYMTLLACFQLLLARHCDTTDVAVGTPIANRTHMASEHLVGTLVNTVVMRTDLAGDPTFADLLKRVRETALQAYAHQDVPFEALVEALALPRSDGSAPLVQVLFNVLNVPQAGTRIEGLVYEPFEFDTGSSQFDLALSVDMQLFGQATLSFSTEVFEPATGQRLLTNFVALVDQVLANPQQPLSSFILTSDSDRQALARWNHTPLDLPEGAVVHTQLQHQALQTPERTALRCGAEVLSHAELQAHALRLARALRARCGARQPGGPVPATRRGHGGGATRHSAQRRRLCAAGPGLPAGPAGLHGAGRRPGPRGGRLDAGDRAGVAGRAGAAAGRRRRVHRFAFGRCARPRRLAGCTTRGPGVRDLHLRLHRPAQRRGRAPWHGGQLPGQHGARAGVAGLRRAGRGDDPELRHRGAGTAAALVRGGHGGAGEARRGDRWPRAARAGGIQRRHGDAGHTVDLAHVARRRLAGRQAVQGTDRR